MKFAAGYTSSCGRIDTSKAGKHEISCQGNDVSSVQLISNKPNDCLSIAEVQAWGYLAVEGWYSFLCVFYV